MSGDKQLPTISLCPHCLRIFTYIRALQRIVVDKDKNFVSVNIPGVTDPDGDAVSITINTIFQDEPVDSSGNGKFAPDGAGAGSNIADVRAERVGGSLNGPGNGRIYHIGFSVDDGLGGSCSGEVTVGVPHDQARVPIDEGTLYDSTVP